MRHFCASTQTFCCTEHRAFMKFSRCFVPTYIPHVVRFMYLLIAVMTQ